MILMKLREIAKHCSDLGGGVVKLGALHNFFGGRNKCPLGPLLAPPLKTKYIKAKNFNGNDMLSYISIVLRLYT